jgi:nitrogenase subunit NifH
MKMDDSEVIRQRAQNLGMKFLGEIPFNNKIEESRGNKEALENCVCRKDWRNCFKDLGFKRSAGLILRKIWGFG